jgi:hypothetical protein
MTNLPYVVECKSTFAFYETIAAFDVEQAAHWYAAQCAEVNPRFTYRVKSVKNN